MQEPPLSKSSAASLLISVRANGQEISTATGFVAQRGTEHYLVTNWHVVAGRHKDTGELLSRTGAVPDALVVAILISGPFAEWAEVDVALYDEDEEPVWLEHPEFGQRVDVVAVRLDEDSRLALMPYDPTSPGPELAFSISCAVSVIGFPFGRTGGMGFLAIWVSGTVASEPAIDFDGLPCFLIDSRTRAGQSGSPVVIYGAGGMIPMADGSSAIFDGPVRRFLGIYSGRINEESDLGIVWKPLALQAILEAQKRGSLPLLGSSR